MGSDMSLTPKYSRVPSACIHSLCLQGRLRTLLTAQKHFSLQQSGEEFHYSGWSQCQQPGVCFGEQTAMGTGDFRLCFYLDPAVSPRPLGRSGGPKSVSPMEF